MEAIDYSTLEIGERYYSTFHLTSELVDEFITAVDEKASFSLNSKVPNYIFALYKPIHEAIGAVAQGTIHVKQKMIHFSDVWLGDKLDVVVTVKDKYSKGEKDFLVIEVDFINSHRLICRHETTHIWALAKGGDRR